jgi:hypothetical protein
MMPENRTSDAHVALTARARVPRYAEHVLTPTAIRAELGGNSEFGLPSLRLRTATAMAKAAHVICGALLSSNENA